MLGCSVFDVLSVFGVLAVLRELLSYLSRRQALGHELPAVRFELPGQVRIPLAAAVRLVAERAVRIFLYCHRTLPVFRLVAEVAGAVWG